MKKYVKGQPCPKCGERQRTTRWCDFTTSPIAAARLTCPSTRMEHMHVLCNHCGFDDLSLPLDAETKS